MTKFSLVYVVHILFHFMAYLIMLSVLKGKMKVNNELKGCERSATNR
jgi:hypothetical protein